tara:strand:+ start:1820 stop:2500 length:681 start_codon:yes stop_codon:yes gene_type:complete
MKKQLPNIITLSNLTLGLIAIFFGLIESNLTLCSWLILIGILLDFLDGKIARVLKVDSEYGKQLDSFADLVTFGIAPAVIAFQMIREYNNDLAYIAFLIPICSTIRLAKYNIDENQGNYFIGLTTTANAFLFSSLPLIKKSNSLNFIENLLSNESFLISLIILFSFLLISNIETFSLKFYSSNKFEKKLKISFVTTCLVLIILLKYLSIPIIIFFYMLLSIIFKPK